MLGMDPRFRGNRLRSTVERGKTALSTLRTLAWRGPARRERLTPHRTVVESRTVAKPACECFGHKQQERGPTGHICQGILAKSWRHRGSLEGCCKVH